MENVCSQKPINFGVNGKKILCWSIFGIEPVADFCPILGYWPSKNVSRDHGIMDRFVSLAKPTSLCTLKKIILCWSIFAKEPIAGFCPVLGYWPSNNESRDHDVTGKLVSLAKPIVLATTGKKKFLLANFFINKHCCILIPSGPNLLTSLILLVLIDPKISFYLFGKPFPS